MIGLNLFDLRNGSSFVFCDMRILVKSSCSTSASGNSDLVTSINRCIIFCIKPFLVTSNVQIEALPDSGQSLSNVGLGFEKGEK